MKLLIDRTHCYVNPTPDEESVLSDGMKVAVSGARFMPQVRSGQWDGYKRFYHWGLKRVGVRVATIFLAGWWSPGTGP